MTIAASKQGRCPVCAAALPRHGEGCWVPGSKVEIGNCYEEAFNALMAAPPQAELLLVHGEPTLTCPPFIPYGHAWLELPSAAMVLDVSSQRARS